MSVHGDLFLPTKTVAVGPLCITTQIWSFRLTLLLKCLELITKIPISLKLKHIDNELSKVIVKCDSLNIGKMGYVLEPRQMAQPLSINVILMVILPFLVRRSIIMLVVVFISVEVI